MQGAYITGSIGRVVLLVASMKCPALCKGYLLYEQFMLVIDFCIMQAGVQAQNQIVLLTSTLNFIFYSFNSRVSILVVAISQVFIVVARGVLHEDESNAFLNLILNLGILFVTLVPLHVLLNQVILHFWSVKYELAELKE